MTEQFISQDSRDSVAAGLWPDQTLKSCWLSAPDTVIYIIPITALHHLVDHLVFGQPLKHLSFLSRSSSHVLPKTTWCNNKVCCITCWKYLNAGCKWHKFCWRDSGKVNKTGEGIFLCLLRRMREFSYESQKAPTLPIALTQHSYFTDNCKKTTQNKDKYVCT